MLAKLGAEAAPAVSAAIEKTQHDLRPVPAGPERSAWEAALDERIRRLAAKVAPTASTEQTEAWRDAMTAALSDLPAMVSLTAAKRAIHRPFRFISDIEHGVREIAAEIQAELRGRLILLQRLSAEISRAANPPAALPAPSERDYVASEIAAMPPHIRALGVAAGAFTQAQVDAALCSDNVPHEEARAA